MSSTYTHDGAAARLAQRLLGMRANREVIPRRSEPFRPLAPARLPPQPGGALELSP